MSECPLNSQRCFTLIFLEFVAINMKYNLLFIFSFNVKIIFSLSLITLYYIINYDSRHLRVKYNRVEN
jgi:hypothetical protein